MGSSLNVYLSWLVPAIMGRMQDADAVAATYPGVVDRVATQLQKGFKQPLRMLYRGILLEPHEVQNGVVMPQPGVESVSFSEDRDAACYFALPDTIMSQYVLQLRPNVQGYLAEYMPRRSEILWHYKWNPFKFNGRKVDIRVAARMHPASAHDPAQFDFVFGTQKEVILKPLPPGTPLPVVPVEDTCPDVDLLNRRFTPPHLVGMFSP